MHFLTHEMLLFFTSIWTTNIHDNLHAKVRRGAAGEGLGLAQRRRHGLWPAAGSAVADEERTRPRHPMLLLSSSRAALTSQLLP